MKSLVIWIVGAYGVYCLLLFVFQRHLIFPRYAVEPMGDVRAPAGVEVVWLETDYGRMEGWYLPPSGEDTPAPALIVAHGNAENLASSFPDFRAAETLGMAVLVIEYPGYGRSAGSPSESSIAATMVAAHDFLVGREEIDRDRIVGIGRSLGGGAVCTLVERRPLAAMVLVSTFTSVRKFARHYLAPGWLVRDPFDNLAAIGRFDGPVLVIHGRFDDMIGPENGSALAERAVESRLIFYDCGHNDMPPDYGRFWKDIEAFLREAKILP